jgi:hypothetical protein
MTATLCHHIPRCLKGGLKLDGRAKHKTPHMDCQKLESGDEFNEPTTQADDPCHLALLCGVELCFSAA